MKALALNSLNQPVDGGALRTRDGWFRWGLRQLTDLDRKLGFVPVIGFFNDEYFRVNFAAQPTNPRTRLNGSRARTT